MIPKNEWLVQSIASWAIRFDVPMSVEQRDALIRIVEDYAVPHPADVIEREELIAKCHADTLALRNTEWAFAAFIAERGGVVTLSKASLLWDYEFTRTQDAYGNAVFTARAIGKDKT